MVAGTWTGILSGLSIFIALAQGLFFCEFLMMHSKGLPRDIPVAVVPAWMESVR